MFSEGFSLIFQYMCDSRCVEYTFPISHYTRNVTLGPKSIHSHSTENVNHEKTSLPNGKEEVIV